MKSKDPTLLESTSTEDSFAAIGEVLRAARIDRGLAINDVVEELRYSKTYIRHLEDGDYHLLPGATYVAGYLRSYAKLVGVDGAALIDRYHQLVNPVEKKPSYAFPMSGARPERSGAVIASIAVVIAAVGYVGWYWAEKPSIGALLLGGETEQAEINRAQIAAVKNEPGGELLAIDQPAVDIMDQPAVAEVAQDVSPDVAEVVILEPEVAPEVAEVAAIAPEITDTVTDTITPAIAEEIVTASASPEAIIADAAEATSALAPEVAPEISPEISPVAAPVVAPVTQEITQSTIADAAIISDVTERSPDGGSAIATSRDPNKEITLRATASSWVEIVRNDGEEVMTKLMRKGDTYLIDGGDNLYLSTGNAGGLEFLFVDGSILSVGDVGEILRDLPLDPDGLLEKL